MSKIYTDDELNFSNRNSTADNSYINILKSSILDMFCTNITDMAKSGKIDPVVGREDEILRISQILGRRIKNNPLLIGEPGVGKTAIIEVLALKINSGDVPVNLQNCIIYNLDVSSVVAGTKFRGEFEERIKAVVDELTRREDVIIFIDEIHTLIGAGGMSGSLDASNILKPALARGQIRCIGATTYDEYREIFEDDTALTRRFQNVHIKEPSFDDTIAILSQIKNKYSDFHNVNYSDSIIYKIVDLTDRYISDRNFPDKAIDLMDEVGSYKKINNLKFPDSIEKLKNKLEKLEDSKLNAVKNHNYEKAALDRDKILKLKSNIDSEILKWKESIQDNKIDVSEDDVLQIISNLTGLDLTKISQDEFEKLSNLEELLSSEVIGQDKAISRIVTSIQKNRIGIKRKNSTIGNFIFLGPTGTGKTMLAKKIAEYLFDNNDSFIRIDMNEYTESHTVSKLIGSPPGYIGYESGGFLTEQVKNNPYSVILFDEIEKAHPRIYNVLLQILDDGYAIDSLGRYIDFKHTLIIMTSNAGSKQIEDFGTGIGFKSNTKASNDKSLEDSILSKALKNKFSPEFLNRINDVIIFNKLNKENLLKILNNECKILINNIKDIGYNLKISPKAKEIILNDSDGKNLGARPLYRSLENLVETPITKMIINKEIVKGNTISVVANDNNLMFKIQ